MRRTAGAVLIGAACLAAGTAATVEPGLFPSPACEPADRLDVSARMIAREDLGSAERIHVDLKIRALAVPGEPIRIRGAVRNALGAEVIEERRIVVSGSAPQKIGYTFELKKGLEHHLEFTLQAGADPAPVSSAYLRVNLDPRLEPERLGDVIQYRATMQGR